MLLVSEMRKKVKTVYDNYTWSKKVDAMPNKQVIAIFYKMQEEGVFRKMKKTNKDKYRQIDLDEYFNSLKEKVS